MFQIRPNVWFDLRKRGVVLTQQQFALTLNDLETAPHVCCCFGAVNIYLASQWKARNCIDW